MDDVPLIYTSKGNLPEASLRFEPIWVDTPAFTKFIARYWLGDEIVKESAFVLAKLSLATEAHAHSFA